MLQVVLFISGQEIVILALAVLILFGSKKIPEMARGLGKGMREFRKAADDTSTEGVADGDHDGRGIGPALQHPSLIQGLPVLTLLASTVLGYHKRPCDANLRVCREQLGQMAKGVGLHQTIHVGVEDQIAIERRQHGVDLGDLACYTSLDQPHIGVVPDR